MLPSPHGHPVDHAEAPAPGPPLPAPSDRHVLSSTSSSVSGLNTTTAGPPGPLPVPAPPAPPPSATATIATTAATAVVPGAMLPEGIVHHAQPYYSSPAESSFPHHHHLPPQPLLHHHQAPLPLTAVPLRRRRSSKLAMPASIRRTASTPNVRAAASPVDPSMMPYGSNGKGARNKLGYHRTSVACGESQIYSFCAKMAGFRIWSVPSPV